MLEKIKRKMGQNYHSLQLCNQPQSLLQTKVNCNWQGISNRNLAIKLLNHLNKVIFTKIRIVSTLNSAFTINPDLL